MKLLKKKKEEWLGSRATERARERGGREIERGGGREGDEF